jgi:hypothetical protein
MNTTDNFKYISLEQEVLNKLTKALNKSETIITVNKENINNINNITKEVNKLKTKLDKLRFTVYFLIPIWFVFIIYLLFQK